MGRKRNRQADATEDASGDSTESCEETNAGEKCCPHVTKAINLTKIRKALRRTGINKECSDCKRNGSNSFEADDEGFAPLTVTLWICLHCGNQGCGRGQKQHAMGHYKRPHSDSHCLVIDTQQWTIWCYQCENEVNIDCSRKKLLEVVELVKKLATSTSHSTPQLRIPVPNYQDKMTDANNDTRKILYNLPKVGGLANLGNTCFFNAVLQCLAQTPFLTKVLGDLCQPGQKFILPGGKHKGTGDTEEVELPPIKGTLDKGSTFTSILCKTLTEMQNYNGQQAYRPTELLDSFRKKKSECMDGGQHDSHELLRHLLELVRNEHLRRYQAKILKEVGLDVKANRESVDENLKSQLKFYKTQADAKLLGSELVFRGVLVSTLECLECHHWSQRTEPFLDVSLPVMTDKPQPPVLKKKNSGVDNPFNLVEFVTSSTSNGPSKNQLKKEKKAARKNRKNRRRHNVNDSSSSQQNGIAEEKQESKSESGSSADIEDNIEIEGVLHPEVIESGYSSEKPSAVASPVSSADPLLPERTTDAATLNTPSPTDVSMTDLTQVKLISASLNSEKASIVTTESLTSPDNEDGVTSRLSNSLTVNSDLTSPDGPAFSLPSNSIISKDSPTSPMSGTMDEECSDKIKRPVSRLDRVDLDTDEFQSAESREEETTMKPEIQNNGINEITSSFLKVGISGSVYQSPSRYRTNEGECSIQSCLNQFTALELMSGSNKVGCEACTARENKGAEDSAKMVCTPSSKQYLISRAPPVLILHLKRFQEQGAGFRKITKSVNFPAVLDLTPVCKGRSKPKTYALYGVVEHSGTLHGGHYVAFVKARQPLSSDDPRWSFLPRKDAMEMMESTSSSSSESESDEALAKASPLTADPPAGRWYHVSDLTVVEVDEATVLQSQAYILFYERIL